jgi:hypothetical protein
MHGSVLLFKLLCNLPYFIDCASYIDPGDALGGQVRICFPIEPERGIIWLFIKLTFSQFEP